MKEVITARARKPPAKRRNAGEICSARTLRSHRRVSSDPVRVPMLFHKNDTVLNFLLTN
jgi:hypothetical protein